MKKRVELTFLRVDEGTGNFIYKGTDGELYVEVEGEINDMTNEGEPLGPVRNVDIKVGEPIYNPEDRFGRNVGSKKQEKEYADKVAVLFRYRPFIGVAGEDPEYTEYIIKERSHKYTLVTSKFERHFDKGFDTIEELFAKHGIEQEKLQDVSGEKFEFGGPIGNKENFELGEYFPLL